MEKLMIGYGEGVLKSSLGKLGSFLLREAPLIGRVREDIRYIRDELQSMDAVVRDLIRAGPLNHQNKVWMLHVLQVACDAELCIDELVDCLGGECGRGVIGAALRTARFISTVGPRYRIAKMIQKLKTRALEVSARRSKYITTVQTEVLDHVAESIARRGDKAETHEMQYYHSMSEDRLVGIKNSLKQLQKKLKDSSSRVIVIYGPAGSGKTTLAKMVYRRRYSPDYSIKTSAWVTLSEKPVIKQVLVDILKQVNGFHERMANDDEVKLSSKLKECLSHKQSILLILDSLWSKDDWDNIKSAFPEDLKGKIVLTTREKNVAQYCCSKLRGGAIQLQPLTFENSQVLCFQLMFNSSAVIFQSWWYISARLFLKWFTFVLVNLKGLIWKLLQGIWTCLEIIWPWFKVVLSYIWRYLVVLWSGVKVLLTYIPYGENIRLSCVQVFSTFYTIYMSGLVNLTRKLLVLLVFTIIMILIFWRDLIFWGPYHFLICGRKFPFKVENYIGLIILSIVLPFTVPMEYKFLCGAMVSERVDHRTAKKMFKYLLCRQKFQDVNLSLVIRCCYNIMSSSLQNCAQHLSTIPEYYVVNRKRITRQWVALGLVTPASGLSRHEVAESYFDELVTRGFIEPESSNVCGKIKYCRINSMVKEVLNKEKSYYRIASCCNVGSFDVLKCLKKLHGIYPKFLVVLDFEGCKGLRRRELKLLCRFVNLKFLSLRNTDVSEIPQKIGKLHYLETLDIRQTRIQKVPEGILDLNRLKHLLAGSITELETRMGDLKKSTSAVEMPMGMEEMSSLETLAYVNATRSSHLLFSLQELTQLKKLGLVIHDQKLSSKPLCISLMMLSDSLTSLSILDEREGGLLEFLEYLCFAPQKLKKLILRGYLGTLPQWIVDLHLIKLTMADTQLRSDAIRLIGKIPTLLCLKLYGNSYEEQDLTLVNTEFQVLRELIIHCDAITKISFQKDATPRLEIFRWVISEALPKEIDGINNLLKLKELSLIGGADNNLEKSIQEALKTHTNKKTLLFEKFPPEKVEKKGPDSSDSE